MPLPHRDSDPVLTLNSHYFEIASFMFENLQKLARKRRTLGKLSQKDEREGYYYGRSWLGFLYVSVEGFLEMKMTQLLRSERPEEFSQALHRAGEIEALADIHRESLRRLRNGTFHFQKEKEKTLQFFREAERFEWAKQLQAALDSFFSAYRVACEVIYFREDRMNESVIRAQNMRKKRTRAS